jgi:hypothetical protein
VDDENARRSRAAARATTPIRKLALEDEAEPDLALLDASERIALVWEVTLDAWASSRRPIPDYARADAPGRMIRGHGGHEPT